MKGNLHHRTIEVRATSIALLLALTCSMHTAAAPPDGNDGIPATAVAAFARNLQSALREGDTSMVTRMVADPLRVNGKGGKVRHVSRAELAKHFNEVFTARVTEAVLHQDPDQLFQNYQGVMFGNGAVWATNVCDHPQQVSCPLLVFAINHAEP